MWPMPAINKSLTYRPLMSLVTKQFWIHGKCYSPLDLQPFKFLLAFLGPGVFLILTQGELSRFCFPDHFSTNSPHISPRMDHKWNTNSSWTHCVIWASPHETHQRSEVLTCHNTFGDQLLSHAQHKICNNSARKIHTTKKNFFKESQKSGLSNGRFLQFCKIPHQKGYQQP